MYLEETKEQEQNESEGKTTDGRNNEDSLPKSNSQKSPVTENQNRSFKSKQDNPTNQNTPSPISVSTASTSPTGISIRNQPGFTLIGSPVMEGFGQGSPKKPKSTEILQSPNSFSSRQVNVKPGEANTEQFSMRFGDERQRRDGGFTLMGAPTNFIEGFGSYSISEISRFGAEQFPYSGNGVSLTLGLPHCENLSMSGTHQTFLPNQTVEIGEANEFGTINTPTSSHSTSVYESINIQNRKRFAAQLLPDFVT